MKPRNKIEREVLKLSAKLSPLSNKQRAWAIKTCVNEQDAYRSRSRVSKGSFYLVCSFKGWQILRYFQVSAKFRYHKLTGNVNFNECMQQWLHNGDYVFLSKRRFNWYYTDSFCQFMPLEVRNETRWGFLGDPRLLGWDGVYFASIQKKFRYAIKDFSKKIGFDDIFRSVNAHSFNETLMRCDIEVWKKCRYHKAIYDAGLMGAVKIAIRHGCTSLIHNSLWWDMLDAIRYLKKDLRNPSVICPVNLKEAHDQWLTKAKSRKDRMADKMSKLRQIQEEKRTLVYMEEQAKREEENKQKAKALASIYIAKRKQFFDMDISDGEIHIKVLRSIEEFYEEGKEMHHCVFANGYYDLNKRLSCLILSAKVNGVRMETLEVDIDSFSIIQCHGKYNQNSPLHEEIIKLVEENMWQIKALTVQNHDKTV